MRSTRHLFLNKYYKRLKRKIKTPESMKNKFYLLIIRLKKMHKDNWPILYQITFCPLVFMRKKQLIYDVIENI